VEVTTNTWASEMSWTIGSCSSSQKYSNNKIFVEKCCLFPGDYILRCKDSYGDGWKGSYVKIDGKRYCQHFKSGKEKMAQVTIRNLSNDSNDFNFDS